MKCDVAVTGVTRGLQDDLVHGGKRL